MQFAAAGSELIYCAYVLCCLRDAGCR